MKTFVLALFIILVLGIFCCIEVEASETLKDVRGALQDKRYEEAVKLIDLALVTEEKDRDFLIYLKGLSLFYSKSFSESIGICDEVIQKHDKSNWYRKAIFLKAQCHMQLKQFEEAESIYSREVRRLLSAVRKEEIAGVYFRFAEALSRKPGKDELDAPPPDYNKAYNLYKKALELEIGSELKDEITFRMGRMKQLAERFGQAVQHYRRYLDEFDPEWMGPADSPKRHKKPDVGSPTARKKKEKKEGLVKQGKHVYEARYHLAESLVSSGGDRWARINLEDLLKLVPLSESKYNKLIRDSLFLMIRTYHIPSPRNDEELGMGVKAAKAFITDFPADARAMSVAYEIGQSYENRGRSEEAISAYRDFLEIKYYEPAYEEEDKKTGESYVERFQRLQMSATYRIGDILFSQKDYTGAMGMWSQYVAQFPNGPQWTNAQQGIVNAEFQIGIDLIADEKYDEAVSAWDKFLEKHPLDGRSRQIMFTYGQLHYYRAEEGKEEVEYRRAVSEWEKLVNKYPNTEESSLALFRIGKIYEEKLGDLEKALESYRKLTWGSWHGEAQKRIQDMTNKKLKLTTERVFRTNEPAKIKVLLRNIEKLNISVYKVDLEAYWRKMHKIRGIEGLDIALISPDEVWEYAIQDYQKYKLFEQQIEIPMDGPGVYAINMGEEDLEATTLVIRSDIDTIIKTSRREVLVFAQNMLTMKPAPGARVLVSDGEKVISEGETGEDGVFHSKTEELKNTSNVTAFVVKDGSVASDLLDISGLNLSRGLTPRGFIYTDRPAYRPGGKIAIRGIIRDVKDGSYSVSAGSAYNISVMDSQGRLLRSEELALSKFGTFHTEMVLAKNAPVGEYRITAQDVDDKGKIFTGSFQVQRYQLEKMRLEIEFDKRVYFRGEEVEATFTASYYYGQPVSGRLVRYALPDGTSYAEETDAEGKLKVTFDTTPMQPDTALTFTGSIEGENIQIADSVFLARFGFSISLKPSAHTIISGEPFNVSIQTEGADGKPVGKDLTLTVYRRTESKAHPILSQVPWLAGRRRQIHPPSQRSR